MSPTFVGNDEWMDAAALTIFVIAIIIVAVIALNIERRSRSRR